MLSAGCGIDLADGLADTDEPGTTGAPGNTSPDSGATTGALTGGETGLSSDTASDGSGGTDPGPDEPETADCETFACGEGGTCELGDDGPVCACDAGFVSSGLNCLRCETIPAGTLPADVPTTRAKFTFLLDGSDPPSSGIDYGRVTLRNRSSGDIVRAGTTYEAATVLMVPGLYDVMYEHREGNTLPKNSASIIGQLEVPAGDADLLVDIRTATLRGAITIAGGQLAMPGLNYGQLWLVNPTTGDRVRLGTTQDEVYDVRVTPGDYEVRYEYRETQGAAPINPDGLVTTVSLYEGSNEFAIDVPVAQISGRFLTDGELNPSGIDHGDIELVNPKTGERFLLGTTSEQTYEAAVLPGDYDIVYTAREIGPLNPANRGTVAGALTVKPGGARQDIHLRTALVSGNFTVNDAVPPSTDFDDGVVLLRDSEGGTVVLGNTRNETYSRRVLVGDYEIVYAQETAGLSMPVNTQATVDSIAIRGDETLDINIPVVELSGTMTIGGELAPDSPYDDGRLFLRSPETGDSVLLGNTRQGLYAARVVPGTYNVVYSNEFSDTILPVNSGALLLEGLVVDADALIDIDVPVATLIGSVGILGSEPAPNEGVGQLFLRDLATDDSVFLGDTNALNFTKPLTAGTYIMEYRGIAAAGATLGTSLPANENAAFACYEIVSD